MKRTATKMRPIGPVRVMLAAFDALTLRTAGDSSNATGCWPAKASVAGGVCQSAADRVRQMQFHQIITKNSTGVKLCRGVFCFGLCSVRGYVEAKHNPPPLVSHLCRCPIVNNTRDIVPVGHRRVLA